MKKPVSLEVMQLSKFDAWCELNRESWASWDDSRIFAKIGSFTPIYVNARHPKAGRIVQLAQELINLGCFDDSEKVDGITNQLQRIIGADAVEWLVISITSRWQARHKEQREEAARLWLQNIDTQEIIDQMPDYDSIYDSFYSVMKNWDAAKDAVFVYGYMKGLEAAKRGGLQ